MIGLHSFLTIENSQNNSKKSVGSPWKGCTHLACTVFLKKILIF